MSNLVETDMGLQVRKGGKAVSREIGPEHEGAIAAALDRNTAAMERNSALFEAIFEALPVARRSELLGVTPRQDLRIRKQRVLRDALKGQGR